MLANLPVDQFCEDPLDVPVLWQMQCGKVDLAADLRRLTLVWGS